MFLFLLFRQHQQRYPAVKDHGTGIAFEKAPFRKGMLVGYQCHHTDTAPFYEVLSASVICLLFGYS